MSGIYFDARPVGREAWGVGGERVPLANPYFVALARHPRHCPRCAGVTVWEGTANPDAAREKCAGCGWVQVRLAPEGFAGRRCEPVGAESARGRPREAEVMRFRPREG